jgi:hypothetical protein
MTEKTQRYAGGLRQTFAKVGQQALTPLEVWKEKVTALAQRGERVKTSPSVPGENGLRQTFVKVGQK